MAKQYFKPTYIEKIWTFDPDPSFAKDDSKKWIDQWVEHKVAFETSQSWKLDDGRYIPKWDAKQINVAFSWEDIEAMAAKLKGLQS